MGGTVKIPLSNSEKVAIIDIENYDQIIAFGKWYLSDSGYAVKKTRLKGKNVTFRMHRVIDNTPNGLQTDHINGNRLDNRRANLRTVTVTLNGWNRKPRRLGRKYDLPPGITYDLQREKYVARRVVFARFDTKEEAVKYLEGENREWK